ncbi:MAG: hypothetical protein K2N56_02825 [Oscillospiraceae bacterium]|nr:hypothetical protein [Oscillospiraceae bacterium]
MNMKKITAIICTFALCASLAACSQTPKEIPKDFSGIELLKWGEADRWVYDDLETLEKASDLVVVGTFIEDPVQDLDYHYEEFFGKEIIGNVHSENTIEVLRVIKGDISVGDPVIVSQGYAVNDGKLITMSDLTPMVKGDTWVFFLSTANDCGYYWCEGDSDGRYPVSTVQNQSLEISEYSGLGVYKREDFKDKIYEELVEKYGV